MVEIKDRLKEALYIRGMTAAELARQSGLDKGSISNYLKGKFIPKQNAIASMARALGVSPAWLMGSSPVCSTNSYRRFKGFLVPFWCRCDIIDAPYR